MHPKNILFSVNDYDKDGDFVDKGIYLHFGGTRVKAAETFSEFKSIVGVFEKIVKEIEDYPDEYL